MIWQHFAMCTQKAFIAWATQKASTSTYCARAPPTALHTASRPSDKQSSEHMSFNVSSEYRQVDNILSQNQTFILHGEQWAILVVDGNTIIATQLRLLLVTGVSLPFYFHGHFKTYSFSKNQVFISLFWHTHIMSVLYICYKLGTSKLAL